MRVRELDLIIGAATVSILDMLAVFVAFTAPRAVPNSVIAIIVLGATGSAAYLWVAVWSRRQREWKADMQLQVNGLQQQLNEMQNEMEIDRLIRRTTPHLKRVK